MITAAPPILNLLLARGVGPKTLSDIVDKIVARGLPIDDLRIDDLVDELHLKDEITANARAVQEEADQLAGQLEREDIRILVRGFQHYPKRLVRTLDKMAPPVLFVMGNPAILEAKGVGFCGSRHASKKAIHVASESARQLGINSINVVSGYAKGVDLAAHCASLQEGGTTTIVLAEGILHFRVKREIESVFRTDKLVVVSEYSPQLPWIARNAMQRNKTIIGLSDAMVCIESGMTGGTHAAAEATLAIGLPLFVADYAQPAESAEGNQHFIKRGAIPLRGDRSGKPNLSRIYELLGIAVDDGENVGDNTSMNLDVASENCGITRHPVAEMIARSLRVASGLHPYLTPFAQAWGEYENYRTARRVEELINNLTREIDNLRQKHNAAVRVFEPPDDFAELLERTVEKVRKEFDDAMRSKYARVLAQVVVDESRHKYAVQLIESLDALSELDLRILELFKGKHEGAIGDLPLESVGLVGDLNSQTWEVACSLAKLEARGLILTISSNPGVVYVSSGLNKDSARWRNTKYRLLPIGQLLIDSIFD